MLTEWKRSPELAFLGEVSSVPLQQTLRHLQTAFTAFFTKQLCGMLEYKAAWYGRRLVVIDRWFPSSKLCSTCGHRAERLPLDVRAWTCPGCHTVHDRDVNAARNIVAAGLADTQNACGGTVRPEPPRR